MICIAMQEAVTLSAVVAILNVPCMQSVLNKASVLKKQRLRDTGGMSNDAPFQFSGASTPEVLPVPRQCKTLMCNHRAKVGLLY